MGSVLAGNLVVSGHEVVTHDVAGPERSPDGATFVRSLDDVARAATVVVCSLPDGTAVRAGGERSRGGTPSTHHVRRRHLDHRRGRRPGHRRAPLGGLHRLCRRPGVRWRGRGSGPHVVGHVRWRGVRLHGGGAGALRAGRPPAPGGGPAGHGSGTQVGQQFSLRHGPGRYQRGRRLWLVGRSRHGHHDRGARRCRAGRARQPATSSPPRC